MHRNSTDILTQYDLNNVDWVVKPKTNKQNIQFVLTLFIHLILFKKFSFIYLFFKFRYCVSLVQSLFQISTGTVKKTFIVALSYVCDTSVIRTSFCN